MTPSCNNLAQEILALAGSDLDPDNVYQNPCSGNGTLDISQRDPQGKCYDAVDDWLTAYLNNATVQNAIHANPTNLQYGPWAECSSYPPLNYTAIGKSMMPYFKILFEIAPNLRILLYSGDVDIATVPHVFTQSCIAELERAVVKGWTPWKLNGVVAGYIEKYDTFTYATIKGAGHEAPLYAPLSAYNLLSNFIFNRKRDSWVCFDLKK